MPEKNQPLIVELEQVHHCTSIEVCDRLREVRIKWLATVGSEGRTITNLFEVDTGQLKRIARKLRDHPDVKKVEVMVSGPKRSQITITQNKHMATAPYLAKTGTAWIQPTWTEGGVDKVTMLAPSYKNLKAFMEMVSENGYDLKIKSRRYLDANETPSFETFRSSGFTQLKTASELLTERQMEAFDLACRGGYYEQPKKTSIAELAAKLGVSESTCAELLRKAERKLLPILNDILRIMR